MAKLPPKLRGKSTQAKLNRLNRRIKNVKRRYNKGGGVTPGGGRPAADVARLKQLRARRGVLQDQRAGEKAKAAKREQWNNLTDPTAMLSGKSIMNAAKLNTKLITKSGIDSKRTELRQNRQATDRDVAKLSNMGQRLDTQLTGLSGKMDQYGQEAYQRAETANADMSARLTQSADQAKNRLNSLQGSVLGQQISSLTGQGVDPSSTGSGQVLGQFAQMQQQAQANRTQATENLATKMAQANLMTTEAGTTAAKNSLNNQQIAVQRNIATRSADRMFQGSQVEDRARQELGTLKSLRGAELVNQLMKLRGTEREFIGQTEELANQRFAARAAARKDMLDAANDAYGKETDRMNAQTNRYEAKNPDGEGGGSGGSGDPNDMRLNRQEFKQGLAAAEDYRSRGNGRITNWGEFLDQVEQAEGLSWTPRERAQFKRRYKKWLQKR